MDRLIEELQQFEKEIKDVNTEADLQKLFCKLAPAFLYGGYIHVRNDYRVYIRTVEFYFHSEKENGIHDPIVYHRNGRFQSEVPYFPLLTLHAHDSGFDITFESEASEYRASVLIRAYEVKNKKGEYLKWEKDENGKFMFLQFPYYKYNTQSTYLKKMLNGFSLGNENGIIWVDSPIPQASPIIEKTRQNVFQSESEWEYIPEKCRCERKWSFTREEQV